MVVFLLDSSGLGRLVMASAIQKAKTEEKQKTEVQLPAGAGGNWWAAVQKQIRQAEYKIIWQEQTGLEDLEGAYHAPNRAHNLRTYFVPEGIRIVRRTESSPSWQWNLRLIGYGYAGAVKAVDEAKLVVSDNRIEYKRGNVIEWYINDEKGLEQGFTLAGPPEKFNAEKESKVVLEMSVSGELKGRMSKDGKMVTFATTQGKEVINYGGLVVKDAAGRQLVSRISLGEGRITLEIDADGARYPLTIDPIITGPSRSPDWMAEGNQIQAHFGWSVATAGDVNGDGYGDVIIGACWYDNSETDEGKAFVYHGSASGLSADPNWTAEVDQASAEFGCSVSTAGDVNGDGYSDVIIGARFYDNGQEGEGMAFVYHGSASGLSALPVWTAESNQVYARLGCSVSTAGDVNGDGYADVIVGVRLYDNGQSAEGAAFVYHGSVSGLSADPSWIAEGGQSGAEFGDSVATAGDVNGDGYCDVIVGAYPVKGKAFVYHGSASGLSADADWIAEGEQIDAMFGDKVATAGDINGDGYCDVIVGAPVYDNGHNAEGKAFVYHGSAAGLSANPAWTAEGDQDHACFGYSVGTAGDINGDGYCDVIVGAKGYDNEHTGEGAVFVYYGSLAGLSAVPIWTAEGGRYLADFGNSVATAGDVNGDGLSDVIVGAAFYSNFQMYEGAAFVFYGRCWLKADLTGDCKVNYFDFGKLANNWSQPSLVVDLTGDNFVDYFDLDMLAHQWLSDNTPPPGPASNPNPPDGANIADFDADLSWTASLFTESCDVYFGTSSPPPFVCNQTDTTFNPGTMTIGAKYYWRINEVGPYDTTPGIVWSFTIMTPP